TSVAFLETDDLETFDAKGGAPNTLAHPWWIDYGRLRWPDWSKRVVEYLTRKEIDIDRFRAAFDEETTPDVALIAKRLTLAQHGEPSPIVDFKAKSRDAISEWAAVTLASSNTPYQGLSATELETFVRYAESMLNVDTAGADSRAWWFDLVEHFRKNQAVILI